jgi:hypothetical protein
MLPCPILTKRRLRKERTGRGGTSEKTGNRIQQAQEKGIACNKSLKGSYRGNQERVLSRIRLLLV